MFEIKNVSKQYGDEFALKNVSIEIGKGLNFIIGASGSGKTTLLKLISGMEQDFVGDVIYNGKNIKSLTSYEKSYYYNNTFGFIWQDFNLIDDLTVVENIKLPLYLKNTQSDKEVIKIMRDLKIMHLADQKVKKLSGGQKQRVAIARELIKKPEVIIADEPTSALDAKSGKIIMDILRQIAKTKTVIIVTHDMCLIDRECNIFEIDKGTLISKPENHPIKSTYNEKLSKYSLGIKNAFFAAKTNIKSKIGRFAITSLALIVSAILLFISVSGTVGDNNQKIFDDLFAVYGDSILDISVADSFTGAAGSDSDKPNTDVTQDISGLYDKYLKDDRTQSVVFQQAFSDIKVTANGKEYSIETSNSVPGFNKLTAGKMPIGSDKEVVVPQSFVKKLNITDEEAIGKTITFKGGIYNWDSGKPVLIPVSVDVTIVGVADTTAFFEYEGKVNEYSIDDSFFFSKSALNKIMAQANMKEDKINFSIRAKTPADVISIKDELNANGIVPLGRFEIIEDIVRLNSQTTEQSSSTIVMIAVLSIVVAISVSIITALMRKKEYAIYKISGYSKKHICIFTLAEYTITTAFTMLFLVITSPIINAATKAFWGSKILSGKSLLIDTFLVIFIGILSAIVTMGIGSTVKEVNSLKTGDR